jgi:hypothetical protein
MRAHMVNEGMHDVYVRVQPQTASVVWALVCVCVYVCVCVCVCACVKGVLTVIVSTPRLSQCGR